MRRSLTQFPAILTLVWHAAAAVAVDEPATRDSDGDGMSDMTEAVLGTDPKYPDKLLRIHHDPTLAEGDSKHSRRKTVPDITDFHFGNVAGNRWVWRIDFADRFEGSGANLLLYLDADNNPATGRQGGATGTDLRLMYYGGAFQTVVRNAAVCARDRGLRGLPVGNSLFFCMDMNLNLDETGACRFRARALCQMAADPADSDGVDWFPVTGATVRDAPKMPAGVFSQALSQGVTARRPWLGWRDDLRAADAVLLDPADAETAGMKPYNLALEPVAAAASAVWSSPVSGAHWIHVLLQDSAVGRERVTVSVDGAEIATLVAAENDGYLVLFSTAAPVRLRRKSTIRIAAADPAQDFRISEVSLTPRPLRRSPLLIRDVATYCRPGVGGSVDVDLCFLTNLPCAGTVRWGTGDADGMPERAKEPKRTYNHRLRIPGLKRGATVRAQAREKPFGELRVEACEALLRNIVAYLEMR